MQSEEAMPEGVSALSQTLCNKQWTKSLWLHFIGLWTAEPQVTKFGQETEAEVDTRYYAHGWRIADS